MRAYANIDRVREAMSVPLTRNRRIIDLTVTEPVGEKIHAKAQKSLHDAIAEHCPNLAELAVAVTLPSTSPGYSEYISEAMFSMPSITKLKISLGYHGADPNAINEPRRMDGLVITKLIRHLSGLRHLEIATSWSSGVRLFYCRRYHIASETLQSLKTIGLGKRVFVSCKCPNLSQFICDGSLHGNGTRPLLSSEQYATISRHINEEEKLVVPFGAFFVPNFEAPDTCEMMLENFNAHFEYSYYEHFYNQATSAIYETWEE